MEIEIPATFPAGIKARFHMLSGMVSCLAMGRTRSDERGRHRPNRLFEAFVEQLKTQTTYHAAAQLAGADARITLSIEAYGVGQKAMSCRSSTAR